MRRLGSTVARLKLKEIDGGLHKRWSMWLNSMQREEPYLALTCTKGRKTDRWSKSQKTGLSSDCRLQLADMKLESLVMAHQLRRREYVPRPCTHRPSHHESRLYPKSSRYI